MTRISRKNSIAVKIAYIGGGSRGWTQHIMADLALSGSLTGELVLYDIDYKAAHKNVIRGKSIFAHKKSKAAFTVRATRRLPDALRNADFVFLSIQPGPLEMFVNDLDIPAQYGIPQSVGDSTGPAGISRALRCAPLYEGFAHDIMRYCPHAWVINYTNPMTLCTSILYAAEPDIKAFGCCHEVFGTQNMLARLVRENWELKSTPPRQAIKTDVAGVNHFTFVPRATWNGNDLYPLLRKQIAGRGFWRDRTAESLAGQADEKWFSSHRLVAYDFLRRFGVLGAAGDRHLAEFVPWYLTSDENAHRWGFLLTPSRYRLAHYTRKREPIGDKLIPSGEEGVQQMEALVGLRPLDTNVNLPNRGQIAWLPYGAVVETNAQFRQNSLQPVVADELPHAVQALVQRVVRTQQLTLEAAQQRSLKVGFEAVLNDPLCRIDTDRAWTMWRKLMKANAAMLPGYTWR